MLNAALKPIRQAVLKTISPEEQNTWPDPVAPGRHPAKIIEVTISEHPEGHDVVVFRLDLLDQQVSPFVELKSYHLKSKKAREFMQGEFSKMGVTINSRQDLLNCQEELLGKDVIVSIQYPSGSPVIYIAGLADSKNGVGNDVWAD